MDERQFDKDMALFGNPPTEPVVLDCLFPGSQKSYEYQYSGPLKPKVGWFGVIQRRVPNVIGQLDFKDYAIVCILDVKPMSQKEYPGSLKEIDAVLMPRLKNETT